MGAILWSFFFPKLRSVTWTASHAWRHRGAIMSPWLAECQSPLLLKVYHGQRVIEESRWSALVGREVQWDTRGKAVPRVVGKPITIVTKGTPQSEGWRFGRWVENSRTEFAGSLSSRKVLGGSERFQSSSRLVLPKEIWKSRTTSGSGGSFVNNLSLDHYHVHSHRR